MWVTKLKVLESMLGSVGMVRFGFLSNLEPMKIASLDLQGKAYVGLEPLNMLCCVQMVRLELQ